MCIATSKPLPAFQSSESEIEKLEGICSSTRDYALCLSTTFCRETAHPSVPGVKLQFLFGGKLIPQSGGEHCKRNTQHVLQGVLQVSNTGSDVWRCHCPTPGMAQVVRYKCRRGTTVAVSSIEFHLTNAGRGSQGEVQLVFEPVHNIDVQNG